MSILFTKLSVFDDTTDQPGEYFIEFFGNEHEIEAVQADIKKYRTEFFFWFADDLKSEKEVDILILKDDNRIKYRGPFNYIDNRKKIRKVWDGTKMTGHWMFQLLFNSKIKNLFYEL